ncbi:hypothetical protein [Pantoea sp. CCBC3-3-1]|uniref:hypothetical protein n=1 Tax=Pantoea sp. CCBC3-3-1 TaxID=2490851 RepID=UPI0011BEC8C9|nr:hypothetical protein [Pantoea sp. CCBC3-3-1]
MLLFPGTREKKRDLFSLVVVISPRQEVISSVCDQLNVRNLGELSVHQVTLEQFDPQNLAGSISHFIFDIGSSDQGDSFVEKISLFLSKETLCIAIGNSDSLLLAGKYQSQGIHYIYFHPDEIKSLGKILDNPGEQVSRSKSSLKIALLSCKGGVGNTSLSFQLAQNLVQQRNVSLLLVQGQGGTRNLDLIARKEIASDVIKIQENLFALAEQSEHAWNFNQPLYDAYDFVVFDHTIYNADNSEIERALHNCHSIILVFHFDLASIRTAKKVIEYNQHLKKSGNRTKRIILCFNQSQPTQNGMINPPEAGNLIGQSVDVAIPFIKNAGDPAMALSFNGKHKKLLQRLTNLTLGSTEKLPPSSALKQLLKLAGKRS